MLDALTQVDNRETFLKRLTKYVRDANNYRIQIALLTIDINHFFPINSSYGYETGDVVLRKTAAVLRGVIREQDYIARIGDNRFAIVLNGIMNTGHVKLAAHKIIRSLQIPFEIEENKIRVEITVGIAICPMHATIPLALLRESESALVLARQCSEAIGIKTIDNTDELSDTWDIELALDGAIETGQLLIYYQPKLSLVTGKPVGAEALLRWEHPSRGFIPPDKFIPIAEKTGHIKPITSWILNSVLRQTSKWTKKWGSLHVSVNIPPHLITHMDITDFVHNALKLWGNDDVSLVLEIIERSLISDTERTFKVLKDIQDMGVKISIDDFGTGYSTLSYFKDIPVNELKVDQSFVFQLLTDQASQNIVRLIIDLAHSFNLKVVAEGVENLDTLIALKKMKCDEIQGYLLGKPMPGNQFIQWLEDFKGINKTLSGE